MTRSGEEAKAAQRQADQFWAWFVKNWRRPLTPAQAEEELANAPESPLTEEEIERIVRKVVNADK